MSTDRDKTPRKRKRQTWSSMYNKYVGRGHDHNSAACLADEWFNRQEAKRRARSKRET